MAARTDLGYSTLSDLSDQQRAAVQAIYEEAFPAWEREPFDDLIKSAMHRSRVQLAMLDGSDVVGLATASRLRSVPWSFLEYFAITRNRRSQGLGGHLWDAVVAELGADAFPMVLEVERPEDEPNGSAEHRIRERRIEFYGRRGARRLNVPAYRVPYLTGEGIGQFALLAVPPVGELSPSGESLRELLIALYVDGYGLAYDDALLAESLASLESQSE